MHSVKRKSQFCFEYIQKKCAAHTLLKLVIIYVLSLPGSNITLISLTSSSEMQTPSSAKHFFLMRGTIINLSLNPLF